MPKHYAPIAGVNAEEFIGELPGWLFSTVKYIWRAPNKNGVEDVIKALEEANKERTKQISALIDALQETVEAMPEDANQQGVMDAIETLKGFLGWAL